MLKEGQEQFVCEGCIGDPKLAEQVRKEANPGKCSYCHLIQPGLALQELADRIHQVIEEHFEPIGLDLSSLDDTSPSNDSAPEPWWEFFGDSETVILKTADLGPAITADVKEHLANKYGVVKKNTEGAENPYDDRMLYQERESDPSGMREAWWEFKEEIHSHARFFGAIAKDRLDKIFFDLTSLQTVWNQPVVREITPGDKNGFFWRARAVYSEDDLNRIMGYPPEGLGPPTSNKAKAGRMNAEGIPVFYGAMEEETCVSEIRPPVGSLVILGRFEILTPIRILDLSAISIVYSGISHFDVNYSEVRSRERFLKELVEEIGRPIMPHEETREYLCSQIVAEYLANRFDGGLDGIIFRSAQRGGTGNNVVLFNHASRVKRSADESSRGVRITIPRQPTIPPPGTEVKKESIVQTRSPRPQEGSRETPEGASAEDSTEEGDNRVITLELDRNSMKVIRITGVKIQSEPCSLSHILYLTGKATFGPMTATAEVSKRSPAR